MSNNLLTLRMLYIENYARSNRDTNTILLRMYTHVHILAVQSEAFSGRPTVTFAICASAFGAGDVVDDADDLCAAIRLVIEQFTL